jgi:hypothetical protein
MRKPQLPSLPRAAMLALAASIGAPCAAAASSLDGVWLYNYSCAGATGSYTERCAAGERDDFELSIATKGARLCGSYELTAQLGNHVDGGDLDDWSYSKAGGTSAYVLHFSVSGSKGEAIVRVRGDRLYWRVTHQTTQETDNWNFSPPDRAVLTRNPAEEARDPPICAK